MRESEITRKTNETDIRLYFSLDGGDDFSFDDEADDADIDDELGLDDEAEDDEDDDDLFGSFDLDDPSDED